MGTRVDVWRDWSMEEMVGRSEGQVGPGHKGLVGHARGQEHISEASRGGLVKHLSFSTRLLFIRVWLVTFFKRCGSSKAPIALVATNERSLPFRL